MVVNDDGAFADVDWVLHHEQSNKHSIHIDGWRNSIDRGDKCIGKLYLNFTTVVRRFVVIKFNKFIF